MEIDIIDIIFIKHLIVVSNWEKNHLIQARRLKAWGKNGLQLQHAQKEMEN